LGSNVAVTYAIIPGVIGHACATRDGFVVMRAKEAHKASRTLMVAVAITFAESLVQITVVVDVLNHI